jgi:hypothetical protein
LNAQLHDDDVADRQGLPDAEARAHQFRLLVDAYGLALDRRDELVELMIEFAIHSTAHEAIESGSTPETEDPSPLWGIAWRARSAAWMLRHRDLLKAALR